MPFDCSLEGGDIHLSPAAETSYRIVGAREEQTVTTCTRPNGVGCRTVMVHRFTVSCAGTSVDWMRIAASIRSATANRAWIENGRLNLVMPTGGALDSPSPCRPGTQAARLDRHVVLTGDCLPWSRRAMFEHLVLPRRICPGRRARRQIDGRRRRRRIRDRIARATGDAGFHERTRNRPRQGRSGCHAGAARPAPDLRDGARATACRRRLDNRGTRRPR